MDIFLASLQSQRLIIVNQTSDASGYNNMPIDNDNDCSDVVLLKLNERHCCHLLHSHSMFVWFTEKISTTLLFFATSLMLYRIHSSLYFKQQQKNLLFSTLYTNCRLCVTLFSSFKQNNFLIYERIYHVEFTFGTIHILESIIICVNNIPANAYSFLWSVLHPLDKFTTAKCDSIFPTKKNA